MIESVGNSPASLFKTSSHSFCSSVLSVSKTKIISGYGFLERRPYESWLISD